jgi:hypothetical protein
MGRWPAYHLPQAGSHACAVDTQADVSGT